MKHFGRITAVARVRHQGGVFDLMVPAADCDIAGGRICDRASESLTTRSTSALDYQVDGPYLGLHLGKGGAGRLTPLPLRPQLSDRELL